MTTLRIEKVNNALPTTLNPDTLYFVKLANNTVQSYITDNTGSLAYETNPKPSDPLDSFLLMGANSG